MAHPNEQVVKDFLGAFAKRDMDTVRASFADDVTLHIAGRSPLAGEHSGADDVLAKLAAFRELTDDTWRPELHDLLGSDQHVVGLVVRTAQRGGKAGTFPAAVIYHIKDGKIGDMWVHEQDLYAFDEFFS